MPYSTLVLTKNEAINVGRCLASLAECDDIVVVDSFSDDETEAIVKTSPVRFLQRAFDTFAGQRNWAIDNVVFKHRWVLHLDADECMTPQLHAELSRLADVDEKSAYMLANRVIFMGRWIRRCTMYPYYQARFLRLGESRFKQVGHGQHLDHATRGTGIAIEPYTTAPDAFRLRDALHPLQLFQGHRRLGGPPQSLCRRRGPTDHLRRKGIPRLAARGAF